MFRRNVAICALLASLVHTGSAHAAPPSAERIKSAAAEYDAGRRSFTDGKFEDAAVHFENAYHDAPNAQTLRNAIRARRQANQLARAATLSILAQDRYADDEGTAQVAKEALAEAAPKLFKLTVVCDLECSVTADGRSVSLEDAKRFSFFLQPGPHSIIVGWPGDRSKPLDIKAREGQSLEQSFTAPPMPVAVNGNGNGTGPTQVVVAPASSKPFGPAVFFIALGVTAVAGGILTWSGIDTLNNPGASFTQQQCACTTVSCLNMCSLYQQGQSEQTRTNILIGVTSGLGLLTAITGLFLTQWSHPASHEAPAAEHAHVMPSFGIGPEGGSLGLAGRF